MSNLKLIRFMLGQAEVLLDEEVAECTKNGVPTAEIQSLIGVRNVIGALPDMVVEHMQAKIDGTFENIAIGKANGKDAPEIAESPAHARLKNAASWIEDTKAAQKAAQVAEVAGGGKK